MIALIAVCLMITVGSALALGSVGAYIGGRIDRRMAGAEEATYDRDAVILTFRQIGRAFESLSTPFSGQFADVEDLLVFAGRPYGDMTAPQFIGGSIALGGALGAILFILTVAFSAASGSTALFDAVTLGMVFFVVALLFVPFLLFTDLRGRVNKVAESISLQFPFFLDLALLVVQAGGTPNQAIETYVRTNPDTPLSRELWVTLKESEVGSLDQALLDMSTRVKPDSVKAILRNLAQSERSTGKVAEFYAEQSEELRLLRSELATRAADRVKVFMQLPTVLMTMAVAAAILAGTFVELASLF